MTKQEIAQQLWSIAGAFPMGVQARAELVKLANDIDGREPCEDDPCCDDGYLWICVPKDYVVTLTPCE